MLQLTWIIYIAALFIIVIRYIFSCRQTAVGTISVNLDKITMSDYEQHHYDKDLLKQAGNITSFVSKRAALNS